MASTSTGSISTAIAAQVLRFDNPNSVLESYAEKAHALGRAAFWKNTKYDCQTATAFAYAANERGIEIALSAYADDRHPGKTAEVLLAALEPLNAKARVALARAISSTSVAA